MPNTWHIGILIHLLDLDPALGEGLSAAAFAAARTDAIVSTLDVPRGAWRPVPDEIDDQGFVGMIVLRGCLTRTVVMDGNRSTEVLAAGDVLSPGPVEHEFSPVHELWNVRTETARLAILDRNVTRLSMRWPEIGSQIFNRLVMRTEALAMQLALSHLRGTDVRLERVLWLLAERHGRVLPRGIVVPLPLTHQLLGELIGTRRPAVTLGLARLAEAGRVVRSETGDGYVLLGHPSSANPPVSP